MLLLGSSSLVVIRFVRLVVMLLMFSCIVTLLIAPLLDMSRRIKAVMELLDAMIRCGVSLSRSIELSAQWDKILAIGPLYPVTLADLQGVGGVGLGDFYHEVCGVYRRLSDLFMLLLSIGGMRLLGLAELGSGGSSCSSVLVA